jgi:hypothetical protein
MSETNYSSGWHEPLHPMLKTKDFYDLGIPSKMIVERFYETKSSEKASITPVEVEPPLESQSVEGDVETQTLKLLRLNLSKLLNRK